MNSDNTSRESDILPLPDGLGLSAVAELAAAVFCALECDDPGALIDILASGVDPNAQSPLRSNETLCMSAAAFGAVLCLRALVDAGADPLASGSDDPSGETALHRAAAADDARCLAFLLGLGADPDGRGSPNAARTPLGVAGSSGSPDCFAALLAAGADPELGSQAFPDPMTWADGAEHSAAISWAPGHEPPFARVALCADMAREAIAEKARRALDESAGPSRRQPPASRL